MTTQAHTKSAELDVVTFGEAMMMFVATQTGDLHRVEQFVVTVQRDGIDYLYETIVP